MTTVKGQYVVTRTNERLEPLGVMFQSLSFDIAETMLTKFFENDNRNVDYMLVKYRSGFESTAEVLGALFSYRSSMLRGGV